MGLLRRDYIDVYSVKPAEKLISRAADISSTRKPSNVSLLANEQYYIVKKVSKIYCYSIVEDEMLYYNELSTTLKNLIMLDGSRFAAIYSGYEKDDSKAYFTLTVTDFKSGEEYSYKGTGFYTDVVFSDGIISVLVDNGTVDPGKYITFDMQCRLIDSYYTDPSPLQILDNENVLFSDSILNVKTGEKINVGLPGYYRSFVKGSDFVYSSEEDKYVYDKDYYQHSYAVWAKGALIYNGIIDCFNDDIPNTYNIFNGITGESAFKEAFEGCSRFAGDAKNELMTYTDPDNNIILCKIGDISKCLKITNDMPVRKLVLSDRYLIAVFYDKEPEIYCFDPETMYLFSAREFEEKYIDAVISGNVCCMLSFEEKKVDVFLLNDFSEKKAVNFPYNSTDSIYYRDTAAITDVKMFMKERGAEVPPEYVFINVSDGTVLGSFTPEKNDLAYNEDGTVQAFGAFADKDTIFSMYSQPSWFLPGYSKLLDTPEKIGESIVYPEGERLCYHYNKQNLFISLYNEDHSYSGVIYDLATGELVEKVDYFFENTSDFCTCGNIRAEKSYREIRIYDGTKHIYTLVEEHGTGGLTIRYLSDPEIILIEDNGFLRFLSLTEQKELLELELLRAVTNVKERSSDGKNYLLINGQYLIDKDNWTIIHDFGLESFNADVEDFYFNKDIGMWGISGWNGNKEDITFFTPDTFEKAYTIPGCLALSPDGNYLYKINKMTKSVKAN